MTYSSNTSKTSNVLLLILSIFSIILSIFAVLGMLAISMAAGQMSASAVVSFRYLAWITLVIGLSALPSGIGAIQSLSGKARILPGKSRSFLSASICLVLLIPLALLTKLPLFSNIPAWFKALENTLLISIPAWWFIEVARFCLSHTSEYKPWGLINISGFISMPVIIFIEGLLLVIFAGGLILWASQLPGFDVLVNQLKNLMYVKPGSLRLFIDQYQPFLHNPGIIVIGILFIALVVPLVEELVKPLALWFFIKRQWSPAEGFIAGVICGGTFAVLESLVALASVDSASWLSLAAARSGTALLHITTAGISGWALTSSWLDGKYSRVGVTYTMAVLLHGTWNFLAVAAGFSSIASDYTPAFFNGLSPVAPWLMAALAACLIVILIAFNIHLRKQQPSPIPSQLPPSLPG